MATFELARDYPLAQFLDESVGCWIVEGVIKGLSSSEAIVFLRQQEKRDVEVEFLSSEELLVRFYDDNSSPGGEAINRKISKITTLWVLVATEEVATPIRVVLRPISFQRNPNGRFTLSIPMEPSLTIEEWHRLGLNYVAGVTINEDESRYISSEYDVNELCEHLRMLPSFCISAIRFEGDMLNVAVDINGAVVDYLDIQRGKKLVSMNRACLDKDIIRMNVAALPDLELETERRHLIPLDKALDILGSFLNKGELIDMVPWPVGD